MLSIPSRSAHLAAAGLLLVTLGCSSAPPASTPETVRLAYSWQPGEVIPLRFDVDLDGTVLPLDDPEADPGTAPPVAMEMGIDGTVEALENLDEGGARIAISYDGFRMHMDTPQGAISFDSSEGIDPDEPASEAFAMLALLLDNLTFDVHLAADGELLDVGGIEAMIDSLSEQVPEEARAQLRETVQATLDSGKFASQLEYYFPRLPAVAVAVGDRWSHQQEVQIPTTDSIVPTRVDSRLVEIERVDGRRVARVDWTGEVTYPEEVQDYLVEAGIERGSLTAGYEGSYSFDVDRGRLLFQEMEITGGMTMNPPAEGGEPAGRHSVDMVMSYRLELGSPATAATP